MLLKNLKFIFLATALMTSQVDFVKTAPNNAIENTKTQNSKIQNKILSISTQTINLLSELEQVLPDLIDNVAQNNSTNINYKLVRQFLNIYNRKISLIDLLQLKVLKQNDMDKRLIPFTMFVLIKSAEILSISYIQNQVITKDSKLLPIINECTKQINDKCDSVINTLTIESKKKLNINVSPTDLNKQYNSNSDVRVILNNLNANKLFTKTNVDKEALENFYLSIAIAGENILIEADINTLKTFINGKLITKMKNETTFNKLKTVLGLVVSTASDKVQNALDGIASIFIPEEKN